MNQEQTGSHGINRRGFLKLGFWGGAALAAGAGTATLLTGCSSDPTPARGYQHLREKDLTLLRPLMGPLLGPGLTAVEGAGPDQALAAFDRLLQGGTDGQRGQLFQLLDLMQLGAARWWITGTWTHFEDQSEEQLQATLTDWANNDGGFPKLAFKGLTQPITMSWYVTPEAALTTGYPGPPQTPSTAH